MRTFINNLINDRAYRSFVARTTLIISVVMTMYFVVMLTPLIILPAIYGVFAMYRKYGHVLTNYAHAPLRKNRRVSTKGYLVVLK